MSPSTRLTYATVCSLLRELRAVAGNPSFAEIARRVSELRVGRGPTAGQQVARSTVFDYFKPDRRRFDVDLVVDIACALGLDGEGARGLERTCWVALNDIDAARIVQARTTLPDRPRHFVGRERELDLVTANHAGPAVVIHGMAGCGKSELAAEAARRLTSAVDGAAVVFVDLRGFAPDAPPADSAATFDAVVRAVGGDPLRLPADASARRAAYSRLLADQRCVLVLDDAASADQVAPLLPDESSPRVFVTSRKAIAEELAAVSVPVDVLEPDAAAEFLLAAAAPVTAGWDRDFAVELAAAVGNLPLALGIVASRIVALPDWTPDEHAAALVDHHGEVRLDDALAQVLDSSHQSLSPPTARALRLLASMPFDDLGVDAFAAALDTDLPAAEGIALELIDASMATQPAPGRLRLHELVRAHARERSLDHDRSTERTNAHAGVLEHYAMMSRAGAAAVAPMRLRPPRVPLSVEPPALDEASALAWTDADFENLLVATSEPSRAVRPSIGLELGEMLFWYIEWKSLHQAAIILYERAVATARELGDPFAEGMAQIDRATCFLRLSEYDRTEDCLRRAEVLVAGDVSATCRIKFLLASLASRAGDWATSLGHLADAAALEERLGNWSGAARAHDRIAVDLSASGDLDGAVEHRRVAAELALRAGDIYAVAHTLANASDVHLQRGDPHAAVANAERALELCSAHGLDIVVPVARTNLGNALLALGRIDVATEQQLSALDAVRASRDRLAEVHIVNSLGEIHLAAGRLDEAAEAFAAAVAIAEEIGEAHELGRARAGLGHLANARGDIAEAREAWTTALDSLEVSTPDAASVRRELAAIDTEP